MTRVDQTDVKLPLTDEWVAEALSVYRQTRLTAAEDKTPTMPDFQQRCRQAALSAHAVERLRAERDRIGFAPIGVGDYIRGLTHAIGVQVEPILTAFQIEDVNCPDATQAYRIGRLLHAMGVTCREATASVLIAFAQSRHISTDAVFARYRANTKTTPLDPHETALEYLKSETPPTVLKEILSIENAVREAFRSDGESTSCDGV